MRWINGRVHPDLSNCIAAFKGVSAPIERPYEFGDGSNASQLLPEVFDVRPDEIVRSSAAGKPPDELDEVVFSHDRACVRYQVSEEIGFDRSQVSASNVTDQPSASVIKADAVSNILRGKSCEGISLRLREGRELGMKTFAIEFHQIAERLASAWVRKQPQHDATNICIPRRIGQSISSLLMSCIVSRHI